MTEDEVKNLIEVYKQRLLPGSLLDFVSFRGNDLELKFTCQDKTEFLVQGKKVTMADGIKEQIEKYLKAKINDIKVTFV
jgi:hypothetical protein